MPDVITCTSEGDDPRGRRRQGVNSLLAVAAVIGVPLDHLAAGHKAGARDGGVIQVRHRHAVATEFLQVGENCPRQPVMRLLAGAFARAVEDLRAATVARRGRPRRAARPTPGQPPRPGPRRCARPRGRLVALRTPQPGVRSSSAAAPRPPPCRPPGGWRSAAMVARYASAVAVEDRRRRQALRGSRTLKKWPAGSIPAAPEVVSCPRSTGLDVPALDVMQEASVCGWSSPTSTSASRRSRIADAGGDEALAVAVVEVAREASTEATGALVTRSHFDTALAQLESRLALAPGHGRHHDRGRGRRSAAVPRLEGGCPPWACWRFFSRLWQSAAPSLVDVLEFCLPEGGQLLVVLVKTPQIASEFEEPGARVSVNVDRYGT